MREFPLQIYANVTKRCNMRCSHCYSDSGLSSKTIDFDRLAALVNKLAPLRVIISGGEPLLVYEEIERFIKKLKKRPFCTLVTNGTIFNEKISSFLKKNIDEVAISLDTLNKKRFERLRGEDLLEKVLENITKISKLGLKTRINYAIFSSNRKELAAIIKFMKKNKMNYLNILRQRKAGRAKAKSNEAEILAFYKRAICLAEKNKLKLTIHDPLVNKLGLDKFKTFCYAGDMMVSIDSEFNFKVCPFAEKSFNGDFDKIWNSKEFMESIGKSACTSK